MKEKYYLFVRLSIIEFILHLREITPDEEIIKKLFILIIFTQDISKLRGFSRRNSRELLLAIFKNLPRTRGRRF